jgi:hypothetical protein
MRADFYRQKAAEAKQSAAQLRNLSMKRAYEEVEASRPEKIIDLVRARIHFRKSPP